MSGVLEIWPNAQRVRRSGQCPICRAMSEYSFVIPDLQGNLYRYDGRLWERCGYWCPCGWSNPGERLAEPSGGER